MGRSSQNRCSHCRVVYPYWWGSTPYTNDPDNSSTYCPECHKAIRLALEAIPKKCRIKYVETDKFTCMDLDPATPEPTDLPPKEEREFVVKPMKSLMSRRDELFDYRMKTLPEGWVSSGGPEDGPWNDLTPEQLTSGDFPDPVYPPREVQEEMVRLLLEPIEDEPVKVTTHKPTPPYRRGLWTDKPSGSEPEYKSQYIRKVFPPGAPKEFSTETLPEGTLPMYDKDPDITPLPGMGGSYPVTRCNDGGLMDLLDPWNHHKAGHVVERDGTTYYYEWWTRTGKAAGTVKVLMEEDIATGEILGPWIGSR